MLRPDAAGEAPAIVGRSRAMPPSFVLASRPASVALRVVGLPLVALVVLLAAKNLAMLVEHTGDLAPPAASSGFR
jgi:hypothetical protein